MEQQMEHVVASRQCIYRIYRISTPIMESQVKNTETGVVYRDCCTTTTSTFPSYLPTYLVLITKRFVPSKRGLKQAA